MQQCGRHESFSEGSWSIRLRLIKALTPWTGHHRQTTHFVYHDISRPVDHTYSHYSTDPVAPHANTHIHNITLQDKSKFRATSYSVNRKTELCYKCVKQEQVEVITSGQACTTHRLGPKWLKGAVLRQKQSLPVLPRTVNHRQQQYQLCHRPNYINHSAFSYSIC